MSDAFHGYGTIIQIGDAASPEVFTTIPEVKSIKLPDLETDIFEVSHLTSPDAVKEKLAGMRDATNLVCRANYLPSNSVQQSLYTLSANRTIRGFKIVLSDADDSEWLVVGVVSKCGGPEMSVDGAPEFEFEITPTSSPTFPTT